MKNFIAPEKEQKRRDADKCWQSNQKSRKWILMMKLATSTAITGQTVNDVGESGHRLQSKEGEKIV